MSTTLIPLDGNTLTTELLRCASVADWDSARDAALEGKAVVVAADPSIWGRVEADTGLVIRPVPLSARADNPLVADATRIAHGPGQATVKVRQPGVVSGAEQEVSYVDGDPVAAWLSYGKGCITIIAGTLANSPSTDAWYAAVTDADAPEEAPVALSVPVVSAAKWQPAVPQGIRDVNDSRLLRAAAHAGQGLPSEVYTALVDFADLGNASGALLIRDVPVGELPPTPLTPTEAHKDNFASEFSLLTIARLLGQPVGYAPEHGGDLIQNISPTPGGAYRQVSTSSAVVLEFHTEAAFHPMMPRYLALLCLRGDPNATTTLTPVSVVLPHLSAEQVELLRQPLFTTGIDESYTSSPSAARSLPRPILSGSADHPRLWLDNDLMKGITPQAQDALEAIARVARENSLGVTLSAGDLLIVDNTMAVHGRSPFTPRFDGTDRWLQRVLIVGDHRDAGEDLEGRIIATTFME